MLEETDPFWLCALEKTPPGENEARDWLVPGREHYYPSTCSPFASVAFQVPVYDVQPDELYVDVQELRGQGVLETIGGEIWEASILLCAHILLNQDEFPPNQNILELGSGCGLPSLLILELRRRYIEGSHGSISLTDNDTDVLHNLASCLQSCYQPNDHLHRVENLIHVRVESLDWDEPGNIGVGMCIGSALCYSPDHVESLLLTIAAILQAPSPRITIIQIKDRPGFQRLVRRLHGVVTQRGGQCKIEEVDENVYNLAQRVSLTSRSAEEGVVAKRYYFPVTHEDIEPAIAAEVGVEIEVGVDGGIDNRKSGLLTTARSDFVKVLIYKD